MIIMSIILIKETVSLDVLPNRYLIPAIIIIVILDIITTFIAIKKKISNKIKIINIIVTILLSVIMTIISFYMSKTNEFLDDININYKTLNYSVVVLKETEYDEMKDLEKQKVGYLDNGDEGLEESLQLFNDLAKAEMIPHKEMNEVRDSLLNQESAAILLEESYYKILTDTDYDDESESDETKSDFANKTKVIYTFSIDLKTGEITKKVENVTIDPFNIYISGLDTYGNIASVSRTDVNMVITINPTTHQILLTSIPRDYYVQLHGKKGLKDKLTHSGIYGIDTSVKTVEDLVNIDINYYFKVNFTSVINIVEELGGVEVYSEYSFTSKDNYHYTKGYNRVNGRQALSFVRERKRLPGGDRQRIKDQQAMIDAIFRKATSSSIITKYTKLLKVLKNTFVTNMQADEITDLVKMQLDEKAKWTITTNSVEGYDSRNYTYSAPGQLLYVMTPNEESVTKASELIESVINNQKLDASFASESSNVHSVTTVKSSTKTNNTSSSSKPNSTSTPKEDTPSSDEEVRDEQNDDSTDDTTDGNDSSENTDTDDQTKEDQGEENTNPGDNTTDKDQEEKDDGNTDENDNSHSEEGENEDKDPTEKDELAN